MVNSKYLSTIVINECTLFKDDCKYEIAEYEVNSKVKPNETTSRFFTMANLSFEAQMNFSLGKGLVSIIAFRLSY